jgi:hypothetical protein
MLRAVHGLAPVATLRRPFGLILTPFVPVPFSESRGDVEARPRSSAQKRPKSFVLFSAMVKARRLE